MLALVSTLNLQIELSKPWMQNAPEHTYLCVNYNIIEAPSCNNLQCGCIGNVLDRDQVSQQSLHIAVVPASLWVSLRKQKCMHYCPKLFINTNYKTTIIFELKYQSHHL